MSTLIQSNPREKSNRSTLSELRNTGFVPAVVYGYELEPKSISVSERDLISTIREVGRNGVMKLDVNGKTVSVVLNDYQEDVLKGTILHADFLAINMKEELEVAVQVTLTGESPGEKEGGIVQQPIRELTIKVKPSEIPETVEVDISGLQIGDTLTVADVRGKIPYEIVSDDEDTLVTVSAPRLDTGEDEGEAADEAAEPEVIGEKKDEE